MVYQKKKKVESLVHTSNARDNNFVPQLTT